jgi:hypothetical protein
MGDGKDEAQRVLKSLAPKLGVYRHYKGGIYVLFACSVDEDSLGYLVHYYSLGKKTRWTRRLRNFTDDVAKNDLQVVYTPRFQFLRDATTEEVLAACGVTLGDAPEDSLRHVHATFTGG